MEGPTLVIFIIFGLLTFWWLFDFFVTHKYSDGPKGVIRKIRKILMAPIYYFWGFSCECGEEFLSREAYEDHIKNCTTHFIHKDLKSWPRF